MISHDLSSFDHRLLTEEELVWQVRQAGGQAGEEFTEADDAAFHARAELARRASGQEWEVYVSFSPEGGDYIEVRAVGDDLVLQVGREFDGFTEIETFPLSTVMQERLVRSFERNQERIARRRAREILEASEDDGKDPAGLFELAIANIEQVN